MEHIDPNPLAGIVYLNSFPTLANVLELNTPFSRGLVAGLQSQDNVTLSKASTVSFTEAVFGDPAMVPFSVFTSWLGQSTLQPPTQAIFVLTRPQNNTNLIATGQAGFPVLFLYGRDDKLLQPEDVLAFMRTWFTNITVDWIDHGSHSPFVDNQTHVEQSLLAFANTVHVRQID